MSSQWIFRLWNLLAGWGTVGLVYALSDRLQGNAVVLSAGWIDQAIAFNPVGIWLYLSFFLMVPLGYLLTPVDQVRWLSRAMGLSAVCAGAVYLTYPTTMIYPVDQGQTLSARLLAGLTAVDSSKNCLPSLHMTLMVLVVWGISQAKRPVLTLLSIIWMAAIAFSTLQLRRHQLIDLVSGAALAMGCGWLTRHPQSITRFVKWRLRNE